MTRCLFLLIVLTVQFRAIAQQQNADEKPLATPAEFGKVTLDELQMKDCSFEKGASAMNLVHYESVEFTISNYGDMKLVTETTCRIKIFDRNGFKNASVIIPYTGRTRSSRITDVTANTYNLDDKGNITVSEVSKKDIFRDKAAEKNGLSSVRFTFPNIKEGSVIEYRYTRIEKNSYFIPPWFFQSEIPTQFSACQITLLATTLLRKRLVAQSDVEEGYHANNEHNLEFKIIKRSYCLRDVPSFKEEPFMTSLKDNLERAEFALLPGMRMFDFLLNSEFSWSMYNRIFLHSPFFGQQFNQPIPGTESFVDSIAKIDSVTDKISAVYQYVKKHIKWDNHYSFYSDNLADVWKEQQGNSAEINISILNLLRKAKVECYPILFSTRENGNVDVNFPNASQFNSVDVMVLSSDSFYIFDGSQRYLSFHVPPLNILNRNAFIVDENNSKWINITDERTLIKDSVSIVAKLDNNGVLHGQATVTFYDFSKAAKLEESNQREDEREEDYLTNDGPDITIDTSYQLNKDNDLLPLQEVMQFHYELPSTGDFYFLNPFLFSSFKKNPFTDTSRRTDIDFGANSSFLVHMEITLPEKVNVQELTKNKTIRTPDTVLLFNRFNELSHNRLVINSQFSIRQAIFDKENYNAISSFFKTVYAQLNAQVLLKKKEE